MAKVIKDGVFTRFINLLISENSSTREIIKQILKIDSNIIGMCIYEPKYK